MDDETRTAVEVEVRRVMQSQDQTLTNAISHLSESYNNTAASYREHLQRQFRYLTIGVSVVLTTIGGAFVFYTGKNIDESKELLQAPIDQKVVEYRIVDNLKHRLDDQVVMAIKNKMGEKEVEGGHCKSLLISGLFVRRFLILGFRTCLPASNGADCYPLGDIGPRWRVLPRPAGARSSRWR